MNGIERGGFDLVFVVPTEPLEHLARAAPQTGFISVETVSAANVALWRLQVFNQLVGQQTLFNALNAAEITNRSLDPERKAALAEAARGMSFTVHRHGIAWPTRPVAGIATSRRRCRATSPSSSGSSGARGGGGR